MNPTLKQALDEQKKKRKPLKAQIVQVRMDQEMHSKAGSILRKRKLSWGEFFRIAAKQLIRDAR